jgi:3-methyladenine DNA glycosylase AlkD
MRTSYESLKKDLYDGAVKRNSFSAKGINIYASKTPSLGIPVPHVKEVALKYLSDPSLRLETFSLSESVELTMCFFIIGLKREKDFAKKMDFLLAYLPQVDSWGVTDICPQFIKRGTVKDFIPYFNEFKKSRHPFVRRFAYVMALGYYRDPSSAYFIAHLLPDEDYYVMMAEAWMLATLSITAFPDVLSFLKSSRCPFELRRKTISKCLESFRISDEGKEILRSLPRLEALS